MPSDQQLNQLLETLYTAPTNPVHWVLFLEQFSNFTGIAKAALLAHNFPENQHRILAIRGERLQETVSLYEKHYFQYDEWTLRFPRHGLGERIIQGDEIWHRDDLHKSVFFNEFLSYVGVSQMSCIASTDMTGVFDAFSVYSGPADREIDGEILGALKILAPHLRTALHTRRMLARLESRIADLENALDSVATGVVLLDAKGKVLLVNKAAQAILDERNGLFLDREALCAPSPTDSAKLSELMRAAISNSRRGDYRPSQAICISRNGKKALQLTMGPLRREGAPGKRTAVAIAFIQDPDRKSATPVEIFQSLFGLTFAEARLALALLNGDSLSDAAELHRVSLATVRSQLKSIFHKTETRRQGELVRLLAGAYYPHSDKPAG